MFYDRDGRRKKEIGGGGIVGREWGVYLFSP
jgi:hypothetical protein